MNAMVPVQSNAEVYRASTDAATLCREIVTKTAMEIQNRRYVRVEGWQALAVAHGCTAGARDVEAIEGGVRAIGEVRRMSDGGLIATAEGFVGQDEPTWYGGEVTTRYGKKTLPKRPDYAIRAMAQTRAISRACRSAFAHVVVMIDAGLSTTPAEEVPSGGFDDGDVIDGCFEPTPTIRKTKAEARPEYERLSKELAAHTDEAALKKWGGEKADEVGALPRDWQAAIRQEFGDKLKDLRAKAADKAADPLSLEIEQPADGIAAHWESYLEDVMRCIGGARTAEEVAEAQRVNARGIEACEGLLDGAMARVAKIAESRLAELTMEPA